MASGTTRCSLDEVGNFILIKVPGPILVRRNAPPQTLDVPGFPIGLMPEAEYDESVLRLEPGDRLYLHSDGVDEQMNADSEEFGRQRLAKTLAACAEMSLEESLDTVVAEITAWRSDDRFTDDVSILAVEMRE